MLKIKRSNLNLSLHEKVASKDKSSFNRSSVLSLTSFGTGKDYISLFGDEVHVILEVDSTEPGVKNEKYPVFALNNIIKKGCWNYN